MKTLSSACTTLLFIFLVTFTMSCSKSATKTIPTVTTTVVTDVTSTTAKTGGDVTSEGGDPVISRGVCISTTALPTIASSKTVNGSGTGTFISYLTGLKAETTYYVRAYATNSIGTAYGNQQTVVMLVP